MNAWKQKKTATDIIKDIGYCALIAAMWLGILIMLIIF